MNKVLVVGGGFAGVAAATALAEKGHSVELLESRSSLGGRVYSIPATENFPAPVDNGPHLLMGCYEETLKLLERLGEKNPFLWIDPLRLTWFEKGGQVLKLNCAPLPAPLHLAWGFLTSNAFPWGEKVAMAKALQRFSRKPFSLPPGTETLDAFLKATRQGPRSRERFWEPLCNAVMNLAADRVPTGGIGEVLHRIFFRTRRDSALAVPAQPLGELGFPRVKPFLEDHSGRIHFNEGIQSFRVQGGAFELTSRSGKTFTADALIWAIPPSNLSALWPERIWDRPKDWVRLGKSPIVSVHVILSGAVTDEPMVGLPGAKFEWVFNRNSDWGWSGKAGEQYLSFTASAAEGLGTMKDAELVELAMRELRERCPAAKDLQVRHFKATREMAATFRWTLETGPLRPGCETPFPNVFLAGDWTDTGLPATIEGACLSGHRAAKAAIDFLKK
ncbi:MAG TPA: hydroxysqualene dehydroxylase HpnE [bacterium]|nr:hydroxysqualene dehydroxylase HpnE [bacterium]